MQETITKLMDIENKVYDQFNVTSRQYGDTYIKMVLTMAMLIIDNVPIDTITKEVRDYLTECNFHQVNHAIDLILHVDKYSMREYTWKT